MIEGRNLQASNHVCVCPVIRPTSRGYASPRKCVAVSLSIYCVIIHRLLREEIDHILLSLVKIPRQNNFKMVFSVLLTNTCNHISGTFQNHTSRSPFESKLVSAKFTVAMSSNVSTCTEQISNDDTIKLAPGRERLVLFLLRISHLREHSSSVS